MPATVQGFIDAVEANPRVEEIILFGSRAVGDNRERSDVDLAIRGRMLSSEDWAMLRNQASEAATLYWISLIDFDKSPQGVQARIRAQGKTIYGQKAS